jgi:hypothetical protein
VIRFSRPARQSAARSRDGYVWREAVAGVVAAYVVGVGAMAAGGIAGSGTHDGGASGTSAFTGSSGPAIQGGVRDRAPAMSLLEVPRLITGYRASPGWDPVTGWGSLNAQVLVPLLARDIHPPKA